MPIELTCAKCKRILRVPDGSVGKKVRCPQCEEVILVPSSTAAPPTKPQVAMWHVKTTDGGKYGPIPKHELDQWFTEGRLTADSQVLRDGADQWQWASEIYPQLKSPAPTAPVQTAYSTAPVQQPVAMAVPNPYVAPSYPPAPVHPHVEPLNGGVIAIAISSFVLAAMSLFCGAAYTFFGSAWASLFMSMRQAIPDSQDKEVATVVGSFGVMMAIIGVASMLFGILLVTSGIGLLNRQQWGRMFTLVMGGVAAVFALLHIYPIFYGLWPSVVNIAIWIGYAVLVFCVLLNDRVARQFR